MNLQVRALFPTVSVVALMAKERYKIGREVAQGCVNFDMPADAEIVFIGKGHRLMANASGRSPDSKGASKGK